MAVSSSDDLRTGAIKQVVGVGTRLAFNRKIPKPMIQLGLNALGVAKRWTFATPPVQMKSSYPNDGPHGRNPVFFIE
ncbi:MAG TPA: hypothetical protein PKI36_12955, partial [Turneriella sp.]|nr:hypothetical protein [Turneriella sp.]